MRKRLRNYRKTWNRDQQKRTARGRRNLLIGGEREKRLETVVLRQDGKFRHKIEVR